MVKRATTRSVRLKFISAFLKKTVWIVYRPISRWREPGGPIEAGRKIQCVQGTPEVSSGLNWENGGDNGPRFGYFGKKGLHSGSAGLSLEFSFRSPYESQSRRCSLLTTSSRTFRTLLRSS